MIKYIVNNCPIYKSKCHECYKYCHSCVDCLIKRVIEKCNEHIEPFMYGISEQPTDTAMTYTEKRCKAYFAMQILDMFEIERIKECQK